MCPVGMVCIPALWFGVGVTAALIVLVILAVLVSRATSEERLALSELIELHLDSIAALFACEVQVTCVVRHPNGPARSVLLTSEANVEDAIACIRALQTDPTTLVPPAREPGDGAGACGTPFAASCAFPPDWDCRTHGKGTE